MVQEVIADYKSADISDKRLAMLDYAAKLTENPVNVSEEDIETLREAGLKDRDIHDLNQVISYFNYVNRSAEGLGVKLEADRKEWVK